MHHHEECRRYPLFHQIPHLVVSGVRPPREPGEVRPNVLILSRPLCSPVMSVHECRSRCRHRNHTSPAPVSLCSEFAIIASSQMGSFRQDVRHAPITSSYVLSRITIHSSSSTIRSSTTGSTTSSSPLVEWLPQPGN